ncbi:BTB domain-containing protein [Mycena kentingensis (nom. inval.)]|nr:BTB domain-containing protein [Mycena kentingensis (nom. inval.)]
MSTDPRPAKCPREHNVDDDDEVETPITRSPDFWFDDGSVVLQVESTQFRVAKSMLAMHSTGFRDMFMLPLSEDQPTVEGCPLVVLAGDTAEDWGHLLGAMYAKNCYFVGPEPISILAALLRLSKKYDIPVYRGEALARFKREYPTTLLEYDAILLASAANNGWRDIFPEGGNVATLIISINLARELQIFSVLPVALCCLDLNWDSEHGNDGVLTPSFGPTLNAADQFRWLQAQLRAVQLRSKTVFKWLDPEYPLVPCDECEKTNKCPLAVGEIAMKLLSDTENYILAQWSEILELFDSNVLCSPCLRVAEKAFTEGRQEAWDRLPEVFALPPWDELKKMDFE